MYAISIILSKAPSKSKAKIDMDPSTV